ncbi:MAG TPA: FKBP-type peptidyl-prolyl cis-trans isomerase [Rhodanobacteraceae bacterium]|nr:FKBP-type peptidyl-prolyl cis-trans isomerase [Rhodanobacteraceae bacterium]
MRNGSAGIFGLLMVSAAMALPVCAQAQNPSSQADRKLSYALGYEAGRDLGQHGLQIDISAVLRGVQDGYNQKKPAYSPQEMQQVIAAMQQNMIAQARAAYAKLAADNLARSQKFFAQNKLRQGVITLPTGVQYKVLEDGQGEKSPTLNSEVTLQYRGAFLDGTVFDNTYDRGEPVQFPVDQMIRGWQQVITRMHTGDHWQVFIPPQMAYGERGQPPRIGPNEALVFDIRLVDTKP